MWTNEELMRAEEEDRTFQRLMDDASDPLPRPMSTPASIAAGKVAMAEGRARAAETLARRIESKELLSAGELQYALGIAQAEIDEAVDEKRLFAFEGPGGEHYYPAFFASADVDRSALERVAQELNDLPAPSKYHFLIGRHTSLGETPLVALKHGRVAEVLQAACGFATA